MFSAIYRYSTKKIEKYVKELSFLKLKTELKNWFIFYCCFWSARLNNDSLFLDHIALSQSILKTLS